jgi:hypothetical protein
MQRQDAGLRRIATADRQRLALQVGNRVDAGVGANDDPCPEIAVRVAHAERPRRFVGPLPHANVRQRRVPRDIDVPFEQRFDLPFVIREEHEVHWRAFTLEMVAYAFPNRDDFGVVGDGA